MPALREVVMPYILPSMYYKLFNLSANPSRRGLRTIMPQTYKLYKVGLNILPEVKREYQLSV